MRAAHKVGGHSQIYPGSSIQDFRAVLHFLPLKVLYQDSFSCSSTNTRDPRWRTTVKEKPVTSPKSWGEPENNRRVRNALTSGLKVETVEGHGLGSVRSNFHPIGKVTLCDYIVTFALEIGRITWTVIDPPNSLSLIFTYGLVSSVKKTEAIIFVSTVPLDWCLV